MMEVALHCLKVLVQTMNYLGFNKQLRVWSWFSHYTSVTYGHYHVC
jgi:hypothetical protein